ncbi:MAG: DUF3224 domain-containing protein [Polyangiaceae bacterium]
MEAKGTFDIEMNAEPPYDLVDGVSLARVRFEKRFAGPLDAKSHVEMLGARTPVATSAGYVAVERVTGALGGRRGTFVLLHRGVMSAAGRDLTVTVVPDSGTGELQGLTGRMEIEVVEGQHRYAFDYALP